MERSCVVCNEAITPKRLEALPNARACTQCQSKLDRVHSAAPQRISFDPAEHKYHNADAERVPSVVEKLRQADWSFLEQEQPRDSMPKEKEPSLFETISALEETEVIRGHDSDTETSEGK